MQTLWIEHYLEFLGGRINPSETSGALLGDKVEWKSLSRNPDITMEFVLAHPDKPWDWKWLSYNPNITMEFVLAPFSRRGEAVTHDYSDKPWDWGMLSTNPNITMEFVLTHSEKPWDWGMMSYNPNITLEDVLTHSEGQSPDDPSGKPWDWEMLSGNPMTRDKNEFYKKRIYKFLEPHFNDDLAWLVSLY